MKFLLLFGLLVHLGNTFGAPDYTIVAPKAFRVGATETVVLNLHHYTGATVSVYLQDLPNKGNTFGEVGGTFTSDQCQKPILLHVKVSSDDIPVFLNRQKVLMVIEVTHSIKNFVAESDVLVSKESGYLFVRTDRPIYRPSEFVRIQVAPLDQKMAPAELYIVTVTVKTPDGIAVFRRLLRLPSDQFIELEYEINEVPELGVWFVEAEYSANGFETTTETSFKIDRYVLPTFNVEVKLDKNYFLPNDISILGRILASYSYGEKVSGNYFVSLKLLKTPDAAPKEFFKRPGTFYRTAKIQNGEAKFAAPVEAILDALEDGENITTLIENKASFYVEATVNGRAEGVLESTVSSKIPFLASPYIIDISRTSLFYTPGLAYRIRVDVLDSVRGRPVANIPVTITEISGNTRQAQSSTHSNSDGQVNQQIDFSKDGIKTLVIATNDPDLEDVGSQTEVSFNLRPYTSPSKNYLQMIISHQKASVGQPDFLVTLSMSHKNVKEIRYHVVSRGSVVATGVILPNAGSVESTLNLNIQQNMVPEARIVAYYPVGTEVVSNSLWFDVVDRCKDALSVTVAEQVRPGDAVRFVIEGASNALVGISGVDRAAYFLYNESRLTPDKMFTKMESYDQGCIRNGGADNRNVFLNAGLVIQSPAISPSQVDTLECPKPGQPQLLRRKRQAEDDLEQFVAKKLAQCDRDGRLPSINEESCVGRASRVKDNQEEVNGCSARFLKACLEATKERSAPGNRFGRSSAVQSEIDLSLARQRTDFQESLIFSTVKLDGTGTKTIERKARDSITTFEIDAISMQQQEEGFCISDTSELLVFKDVFIQLYIPYSLKLREQASIRLSVFNYASDKDYVVEIEVKLHSSFCAHYPSDKWSQRRKDVHLFSNSAVSDSFAVLPLSIPPGGLASLEVRVLVNRRILDSVKKEILIEPEGEVKDTFQSFPISSPFPTKFDVKFDFPEQFVSGTRSCNIYAYTNFLGPSIEVNPNTGEPKNIASIFRAPFGCGEQNMLVCGPNVFAHAYLEAVGKLNSNIKPQYDQSIKRMEDGYKRELTFRSKLAQPPLSAFAVWNNHVPSTWLNAYVDKVFSKAKLYFKDLDTAPICSSLKFLIGEQQRSGYFREKRAPYHREMVGAVGGQFTLTAYVLVALEESGSVCPDMMQALNDTKDKAVTFLRNNMNDATFRIRPYAISLLTYALALHDPNSQLTMDMFERLNGHSKTTADNRMVFWQGRKLSEIQGTEVHDYWYRRRPQAIDVETTAYALLAHIEIAKAVTLKQEDLDRIRKITLWLVSQRNEGGAFRSTQDTVIGLQALSTYEIWLHSLNPQQSLNDISLSLVTPNNASTWGPESPHIFEIDESNNEFKQTIEVPSDVIDVGSVTVEARGTGEGILSYRCVYRTVVEEGSCHFEINANVEYNNLERHIADSKELLEMKLTITVSKRNGSNALMSIIDIGLLSGWVPIPKSVSRLSMEDFVDGIAERYEITNQNVILYLRNIEQNQTSLTFNLVQNIEVRRPQPVQIKVYDYYEPSVSCSKFYALPDNLPNIRTTNCDGNSDDSLCRCAEGGCMTCRSRKQQLLKTICLRGEKDCEICKGGDCKNMFSLACKSNFAYVVTVTAILPSSYSDVFITFKGTINTVLKNGDDTSARKETELIFLVRKDCFDNCIDPEFLQAQRSENKDGNYFRIGSSITVMGARPDTRLDRNGKEFHHYMLDKYATLERHIPADTCKRWRKRVKALKCKDANYKNKKERKYCKRGSRFVAACNNFDDLVNELAQGCD